MTLVPRWNHYQLLVPSPEYNGSSYYYNGTEPLVPPSYGGVVNSTVVDSNIIEKTHLDGNTNRQIVRSPKKHKKNNLVFQKKIEIRSFQRLISLLLGIIPFAAATVVPVACEMKQNFLYVASYRRK